MSAFKGFQNSRRNPTFAGFPNINVNPTNFVLGFPGCTALFNPQYGLNTYTNGAAVTRILDQIKGINFNQSVGSAQPILVLADANFNNLPTIQRNSNQKFMRTAETIGLAQNFTILYVGKADSQNGVNAALGAGPAVNASLLSITPITLTGATTSLVTSIDNTSPHIIVATKSEIVVDGVSAVTGNADVGTSISAFGIDSVTNDDVGRMAFLAVFNQAFPSADLVRLSDNANQIFAIY